MLKNNDIYNGWTVLSVQQLSDYKSTGIWLKHNVTHMEIFHLLNDDEENLFSFGFQTLPSNSTGIPHIIEHSVLAGSKHYPLKDPFMQLCNQSVNTFLNAMTYPDKTLYPAASIAEADYFNLMAVYGDAVFFPILDKKTFEQEGYHIEVDKNDTLSIQGVVYNEMKGAFSEFNRVVYSEVANTLWPNTVYSVESGGDPAAIPHLTYEEFKNFHKKYYSPSNCRLFLYGNVSTEQQIDFINKKFLSDTNKDFKIPTVDTDCYTLNKNAEPVYSTVKGPTGENEKGATVLMSWDLGATADTINVMNSLLLSELLMGNDSSPLAKALIDSGLGDDIFPWRECDLDERWISMGVGLRGVKKENAKKLEKLILQTLTDLVKNGIDSEFVESAIMAVDFEHREVTRDYGPYALKLMDQIYRGWMNGTDPFSPLLTREAFATIKKNIENDTKYIQTLINTLLVENKHRSLITVIPDKSYTDDMNKKEQENISLLTQGMSKTEKDIYINAIRDNQEVLKTAQLEEEKDENRALIPHLYPSQLKSTVNRVITEQTAIDIVPLFIHNQPTNGIVYVTVAIPVDVLDIEDYLYMPLYSLMLTNSGCNGKTWAETELEATRVLGGLAAKPFASSILPTKRAEELTQGKNSAIMGRHWLFVNLKMLEEKSEPALKVLFDCLDTADFTDIPRLKDMVIKLRNGIDNAVIPGGSQFASSRSCCTTTRTKAVDEIWNGLTQLMFLHSLTNDKLLMISERLQHIQKKIQKAGMILNLTSDDSGIQIAHPALKKFVTGRLPPIKANKISDDAFYALTDIPTTSFVAKATDQSQGLDCKKVDYTRYVVSSQIGFAASTTKAAAYGTPEATGETLLAHWMSNNILYEQIRTVGGAYGAGASVDAFEQLFKFYTYRDPDPDKSTKVFVDCINALADIKIDKTETERVITGCYSKLVQPRSPSANGFTGFVRILYGITDEDREKNMQSILSAKPKDIILAGKNLKNVITKLESAIISGKKASYTGKIVELPV
jgi:Zn-dependent M16 (insulinase) family peptidase